MLANRIAEFRLEKGLTQEELASALLVTRQTVISLEKNRYVPSLEMAFKVARFFGMAIEEIFAYSEGP
ncbi:MAG TPA: helix-turn-helix transcriptional regulator [Rectinemataceae bacterium]|nr:helix-turn-helix transcriptional regulator [Rectinemataceae bacterium]